MSFENPGEIGQQRENSDSTSGVGHRRWFLRASVAGVVGVAVAETTRRFGLWHLADLGIGDLAELERELTKEREEFAKEYLESGEMPGDEEKIAELFVVTELVRYFRENQSQSEVDIETFEKNTYRPFMDGVATHFAKRQEETDPTDEENVDTKKFATPSVALIANAKLALYDQIGAEPFYWAKKNNIIDA
ncbi:MAG: hypothetical protein QF793_00820, partial [Candidatus Peribacteraceae bacterium]|nr:hypothetical protein [Candidatus Peribacteraceae bacterium]